MKFNPFSFIGTKKSSIKIEDFLESRYLPIYKYHSKKRLFRELLEKTTLEKANQLILNTYPKRVKKAIKLEMVDCVIIFLKYMSVNYDYYPGEIVFNKEFDKIITYNFKKFLNN